jgi:uncharacterized membrane protein
MYAEPYVREDYAPDLNVSRLFSRCWPIYKANLLLIVGSFAIYVLLSGSLGPLGGRFGSLISFVITGPLAVGLLAIMLRLLRGEETDFPDLLLGFKEFGRAFGVYVMTVLLVIVGTLLLIVPGIIVAVGLWPALFLVYDDDRPVIDTLQRAWDLTRGHRWPLFILGLVLLLVTIAGVLALGIGVFFTGAFAVLVASAAYEELALSAGVGRLAEPEPEAEPLIRPGTV